MALTEKALGLNVSLKQRKLRNKHPTKDLGITDADVQKELKKIEDGRAVSTQHWLSSDKLDD